MAVDLDISIINHSNPEMLRDCLRSIYAGTRISFQVYVVDNATGGRLVAEMQAEFPLVRWIFNEKRLGFSANHNQVLSISTAAHAMILNDDTIVHGGALDTLVKYLDAQPGTAMAGPRLLNRGDSIQNSTFGFMTLRSEAVGICLLPRLLCRLKTTGSDPAQYGNAPADVDWILGACIVIRKDGLADIGLLDAELSPIANTEEVDWCYRAKIKGWKVAFVPEAVVTHFGGQSMKAESNQADRFRVEMHRTRLAFFAKHHGVGPTAMLRAIYVLTLPVNLLMLWQGERRGRICSAERRSQSATFVEIARMALRKAKATEPSGVKEEPQHA